jgi:hypothetical protein
MSIVKKASQIVVSLGRQEPTALLMLVWKRNWVLLNKLVDWTAEDKQSGRGIVGIKIKLPWFPCLLTTALSLSPKIVKQLQVKVGDGEQKKTTHIQSLGLFITFIWIISDDCRHTHMQLFIVLARVYHPEEAPLTVKIMKYGLHDDRISSGIKLSELRWNSVIYCILLRCRIDKSSTEFADWW